MLVEAFNIRQGEIACLVGGGGKTTLMYALARELVRAGQKVVTTTTTRIWPPAAEESPHVLLEKQGEPLFDLLPSALEHYRHVTVARLVLESGKLKGLTPESVNRLSKDIGKDIIFLVEADGSAQHSLKAPNDTEPVLPDNCTLVVPVVGIDVLGAKLGESAVFRAEIASRLLDVPLGSDITLEMIAVLITSPEGIARGTPATARIIPFVNKMDVNTGKSKATLLAEMIKVRSMVIKRVVIGKLKPCPFVTVYD